RCPTSHAALPCPPRHSAGRVLPCPARRAALPCLLRHPAGRALPCPARRAALLVVRRPPLPVASVNENGVLAPPSLGQRRRLGRMYGRSSRPFTVGELLDRIRRAAGDRCGVAVGQGARQLQLTGLGDG
ncbi:unnamed protein product, partial [Closterium sp. NIES-54]